MMSENYQHILTNKLLGRLQSYIRHIIAHQRMVQKCNFPLYIRISKIQIRKQKRAFFVILGRVYKFNQSHSSAVPLAAPRSIERSRA